MDISEWFEGKDCVSFNQCRLYISKGRGQGQNVAKVCHIFDLILNNIHNIRFLLASACKMQSNLHCLKREVRQLAEMDGDYSVLAVNLFRIDSICIWVHACST